MSSSTLSSLSSAISDYYEARQKATLQEITARFTGTSIDLFAFEEVRQKLRAQGTGKNTLKEIPLDAIIGSVNRYEDFTRDFLPRRNVAKERWAVIKAATQDMAGLPPIEVYQLDQVYFVLDGNHRVSVARQSNATHIQAYVTEIPVRVPITPDIQPDDLILKAELLDFLEKTNLDKTHPDADLSVSVPGAYTKLIEHISVHRYFMGQEKNREISEDEAAAHWYETVYWPVVSVIREQGILRDFPDRTEADLYLWITEHRAALEKELDSEITNITAASDLVYQSSNRLKRVITRVTERFIDAIIPDPFEAGPPPGEWRREKVVIRDRAQLFRDILVPINGRETGWFALDQAVVIARRENARIRGLHVLSAKEHRDPAEIQELHAKFEQSCQQLGVEGKLSIVVGEVARQICERARWMDIVIVNLSFPPGIFPLQRLSSGFRTMVQRCSRPILAAPQQISPLESALLAYGDGPRAREALFAATYIAGQWKIPLVVLSVEDKNKPKKDIQGSARTYLEARGITAKYINAQGQIAEMILQTAEENHSDFIIMGGYSQAPLINVLLDTVVDKVLRKSHKPMLLCR
jgi:nucleotide-binding universal stress UspA family protein